METDSCRSKRQSKSPSSPSRKSKFSKRILCTMMMKPQIINHHFTGIFSTFIGEWCQAKLAKKLDLNLCTTKTFKGKSLDFQIR